jgi:hypothetical protein
MVRAGWQGWPAVSARRLSELDKGERRRAWLHTVAVLAVAWVVLVGVYYLVPTGVLPASRSGADSFLRLGAGVALFAAILAGQTRRIIRAELPELRAVEALGVVIPSSWSSSRPGTCRCPMPRRPCSPSGSTTPGRCTSPSRSS